MGHVFSKLSLGDIAQALFKTSWIREALPGKPQYSTDQIPDLTGKVAIVTGGNTGIGYHTVKALLEHNAKVYLAARNPEKAHAAIEKLKSETNGKEAIFLELDLGNLENVKRSAEEFQSKESALHMLFNSAGVMIPPIEEVTKQGYDLQFGTNVLGHFYFTTLLLPILRSTARSLPPGQKGDVRVINTASSAILWYPLQDLMWNTLKDGPARKKTRAQRLYAQSKVGNVLLTNEFARRYGDEGIVSVSLNPGNLSSDLYRHIPSGINKILASTVLFPPPYGALTQLYAGTSEEGRNFNGKYLIPWARLGDAPPIVKDEALAKALWEWCEEQIASIQ